MTEPALLTRVVAEIRQLHAFFEDWFAGRIEHDEQQLSRVADVLDETFFLIAPSGERLPRMRLLRMLDEMHGSREADFEIRVEEAEGRNVGDGLALMTYFEVHRAEAGVTRRRTTALLRAEPETPNGVAWMFVHETWFDDTSSNSSAPHG